MMKINILTLFPELYSQMQKETIVKKAIESGELVINIVDFREYSENKHKKVDDYPYGGGEGMLLLAQPIDDALIKNSLTNTRLIYTSPKGAQLDQAKIYSLAKEKEITILVGRYEGVDERIFELYDFEEISIGDYILSGGDLLAQVIIDSVARVLPNVLNNPESYLYDTFTQPLLEHPQYTRPEVYKGLAVPSVLLSGHHKNIEQWKHEKQLEETKVKRPDLYEKYVKGEEDEKK